MPASGKQPNIYHKTFSSTLFSQCLRLFVVTLRFCRRFGQQNKFLDLLNPFTLNRFAFAMTAFLEVLQRKTQKIATQNDAI